MLKKASGPGKVQCTYENHWKSTSFLLNCIEQWLNYNVIMTSWHLYVSRLNLFFCDVWIIKHVEIIHFNWIEFSNLICILLKPLYTFGPYKIEFDKKRVEKYS